MHNNRVYCLGEDRFLDIAVSGNTQRFVYKISCLHSVLFFLFLVSEVPLIQQQQQQQQQELECYRHP